MNKLLHVVIVLVFCAIGVAQDYYPRPYLQTDFNLNGGGFSPVGYDVTGGVGMEMKHFVWNAEGTFDAARKANDGTKNNRHGNTRIVDTTFCGRTNGGWLYCGYAVYANLRTSNYTKNAYAAALGGGYDFKHLTCPNCKAGSFTTARLILLAGLPLDAMRGKSDADKEHGIVARFTIPSPYLTDRHWFFEVQAAAAIIRTSPHGHYGHDADASFGVRYVFGKGR